MNQCTTAAALEPHKPSSLSDATVAAKPPILEVAVVLQRENATAIAVRVRPIRRAPVFCSTS